jgi:SAM-dependent methyltransferase/uncharacterized protein YbaR (Trm112 family)
MRPDLLSLMACARCGGRLTAEGADTDGEIQEGVLRCGDCGAVLPVRSGIPRAAGANSDRASTAAFSSQWRAYGEGEFERGMIYGRSEASLWQFFLDATGISDSMLEGCVVLDAGCGPASISRQAAQRGARAVVALDLSDAVDVVHAETHSIGNLHTLQADLSAAPLRAAFDLVWSAGVIHHTEDAAAAFHSLSRYVRPGGLLFVYVYPRGLRPFHWANTTQWTQALLAGAGLRRLPTSVISHIANLLSYPTVGVHRCYRAVRRLPGLRPRTANARDSVVPLTRQAFALIWHDALVPPRTSWHSEREVVGWFRAAGFTDVVVAPVRPLGVRGRAPA